MKYTVTSAMLTVAMISFCLASQASQPVGPATQQQVAGNESGPRDLRRTGLAAFQAPSMWEYSRPLVAPENREKDRSRAQKDPTLVFYGEKWHLFMTVKLSERSAIEYCSFSNWEDADLSRRTLLKVSDSDYFCAPQVFYFSPHRKWYLIYQMGVPGAKKMWVAYSTTENIADPTLCMLDKDKSGKGYGRFEWRLGMLTPVVTQ